MTAVRNTLSGFAEEAHVSNFEFENQRRTFHSYGREWFGFIQYMSSFEKKNPLVVYSMSSKFFIYLELTRSKIKSPDILEFEMMQKGTINLKWWDYIKGDINI